MLEISRNLIHKLITRITRRPDAETDIPLDDLVKGVVCDQLNNLFHISSPWPVFQKGGNISSEDGSARGKIASAQANDGSSVWALTLRVKDFDFNRRRWIYYIGLRSSEDTAVTLYYAKCCYDHMAGSVNAVRPIQNARDPFPDPLFFNEHFRCMSGKYPLPLDAALLTHTTLPTFINHLQDETRTIPLILLSSPWMLSPEILQDRMLGSAIVYWCEDASVAMRLNSIMPKNMYTPWESVRIFVPLTSESVFHPLYTYDDIRSFGEAFVPGLIRAYCQSLRAEDVRSFPTIDDVIRIRERQQISSLTEQLKVSNAEGQTLQKQCEELIKTNADMEKQLAAIEERPDLDEYESLLNDTMIELDALKKGMTDLSTNLYACNGEGFKSDAGNDNPYIQELCSALRTYLTCAARRK